MQFSRCVKMANGNKPLPSSRIQNSAMIHEYKPVSANNGGSIVLEFSDEDDDDDDLGLGVISWPYPNDVKKYIKAKLTKYMYTLFLEDSKWCHAIQQDLLSDPVWMPQTLKPLSLIQIGSCKNFPFPIISPLG